MIFKIIDRKISVESEVVLSYSLDYVATFEFDEEWNNKIVTARFVHENGNMVEVILDSENSCNIPLFPKGIVNVGVYTDEFTSTYAPMRIYTSIKDIGEHEVIPPTADVYQQIISLIEEGRIKGDDGFSPTVDIEDIEGGHKVIITDAEGDKEFDVMDGEDYVITESDYQAIADRVPQPDLSEFVKTLKALIKLNEGQTYDVYESESEDYTKAISSGAYWGNLDMVGGKSEVRDGEIISSQTDEVVVRGRNLVSGFVTKSYVSDSGDIGIMETVNPSSVRTEAIEIEPNAKYFIYPALSSGNWGAWLDADMKGISGITGYNKSVTAPSNAKYLACTVSFIGSNPNYADNFYIAKESTFSGYLPYHEPQTIPTNFPVLKSAGNVYDYIDLNKGELHRRVGVVDLGSLNWSKSPLNGHLVFTSPIDCNPKTSAAPANLLCENYTTVSTDSIYFNGAIGIGFHPTLKTVWVHDTSYTDATSFKSAMQGVMLHYELAEEVVTPITIPTDFTEWLEVESNGSITFVNNQNLLVPNRERFVRKLNEVQ